MKHFGVHGGTGPHTYWRPPREPAGVFSELPSECTARIVAYLWIFPHTVIGVLERYTPRSTFGTRYSTRHDWGSSPALLLLTSMFLVCQARQLKFREIIFDGLIGIRRRNIFQFLIMHLGRHRQTTSTTWGITSSAMQTY